MLDIHHHVQRQGSGIIEGCFQVIDGSAGDAVCFQDFEPFPAGSHGKYAIQKIEQFLSVVISRLQVVEPWVILKLFDIQGQAKRGPEFGQMGINHNVAVFGRDRIIGH